MSSTRTKTIAEAKKVEELESRISKLRRRGKNPRKLVRSLHRARGRLADLRRQLARERSPKAKFVRWISAQEGTVETPPFSNDGPKIRRWQRHTARGAFYLDRAPYCGIGCENGLARAGFDTDPRMASVAWIEDAARSGQGPFDRWTTDPRSIGRDEVFLVVLFGRGVHVEGGRKISRLRRAVRTTGFNTSSGVAGSQSNGGGVFRRWRPFEQVHGYAVLAKPKR